jgi:hypothetical protein
MAKRTRKPLIPVFIVSWFPIGAKEAATIMCLSRDSANDRMREIAKSFEPYFGYDPIIRIDREERRADF